MPYPDLLHTAFEVVGVLTCAYVLLFSFFGPNNRIVKIGTTVCALVALLTVLLWVWDTAFKLAIYIGAFF